MTQKKVKKYKTIFVFGVGYSNIKSKIWAKSEILGIKIKPTTWLPAKDDISKLLSPRDRLTTQDTENPAKSLPYLRSEIGCCDNSG